MEPLKTLNAFLTGDSQNLDTRPTRNADRPDDKPADGDRRTDDDDVNPSLWDSLFFAHANV